MRYVGGKSRAARHIVAQIADRVPRGGIYWEPFCGGLSVSVELARRLGPGITSDANLALIALYQAVKTGWMPPEHVSEAEYAAARILPDSDPRKAFCAIACSFAGKWFGGYARGAGRNWAAESSRALLRDVPKLAFICQLDFFKIAPASGLSFIYADPPYAGTLAYPGAPDFDSCAFWQRCIDWSAFCPVFVSEYVAPCGELIWQQTQQTTVNIGSGARKTAIERLFFIPQKTTAPDALKASGAVTEQEKAEE